MMSGPPEKAPARDTKVNAYLRCKDLASSMTINPQSPMTSATMSKALRSLNRSDAAAQMTRPITPLFC
jgi:hypothetical protein